MRIKEFIVRLEENGKGSGGQPGPLYEVVADGAISGPLCNEEVLGQVVSLIYGEIQCPRFRMFTPEELLEINTRKKRRSDAGKSRTKEPITS